MHVLTPLQISGRNIPALVEPLLGMFAGLNGVFAECPIATGISVVLIVGCGVGRLTADPDKHDTCENCGPHTHLRIEENLSRLRLNVRGSQTASPAESSNKESRLDEPAFSLEKLCATT